MDVPTAVGSAAVRPGREGDDRSLPRRAAARLARVLLAVVWSLACGGVLLAAAAGLARLTRVVVLGPEVLLAGAAPALLAAATPGLVLALLRRRRRWAAVAALCLLGQLVLAVAPGPPAPAPAAAEDGAVLRVLTHNVFVVNGSPQEVAAQVREAAPDVLALQEVSPRLLTALEDAGTFAGLPHRVSTVGADAGPQASPAAGEGVVLASRYPLRDPEVLEVGVRRWPAATVRTGGGDVRVVAVHVVAPLGPAGVAAWRDGLSRVAGLAGDGGPLVVAGDLNSSDGTDAFDDVAAAGLRDAAAVVSDGRRPTWPAGPLPRVWQPDHVLAGGGVRVVAVASWRARAATTTPSSPTWCWRGRSAGAAGPREHGWVGRRGDLLLQPGDGRAEAGVSPAVTPAPEDP